MSSPLAAIKDALASAVVERLSLSAPSAEELARQIKVPDPEHGDLALPCFVLAKAFDGDKPPVIAERIAAALSEDSRFESAAAVGPYVNVRVAAGLLAERVLGAARTEGYGGGSEGAGKTVVIDFSSPNIAKPLAFHHIRSTVIGQSVGRIHAARGWSVKGINYLGDWGKQFGLLATGFARHGDPARRADAKHLVEVYVKSNKEADVGGLAAKIRAPEEADALKKTLEETLAAATGAEGKEKKKLEKSAKGLEKKLIALVGGDGAPLDGWDEKRAALEATAREAETALPAAKEKDTAARAFLRRMEEGDEDALAEWRAFRETSIEEFQRVYARMGIHFDSIEGESFYGEALEPTLEAVRQKPGTREDQGAEVVDIETGKGKPPVILRTRDGTTLYVTRDIAAARDRKARFDFDRSLYVVAADQSLHFEQLFLTLKAMGHDWADQLKHVPFGRVHGMSTRRGNLVFLDEVLEEAVRKAREICEQSDRIAPEHLDEAVEAIGVGAVIFGDLKGLRTTDYSFVWTDILDFRGHTAPYVQFSHARACSILRKAGGVPSEVDPSRLTLPEEREVLKSLAGYPDSVLQACESFEPSIVTRHVLELAQRAATWLSAGNQDRDKRVIHDDDAELQGARLALVDAVRQTLAHGLGLLGVRAPEAM